MCSSVSNSRFLANVKEHATLSAGASVDHGVEVEVTEKHGNGAAGRGYHGASCSATQALRVDVDAGSIVTRRNKVIVKNKRAKLPVILKAIRVQFG